MDFGAEPLLLQCILEAAPWSYREIHGLNCEAHRIATRFMSPRVKRLRLLRKRLYCICNGSRELRPRITNRIIANIALGSTWVPNIFRRYIYAGRDEVALDISVHINWVGDLLEIKFTSGHNKTVTDWIVDNGIFVDICCYTASSDIIYWYHEAKNSRLIYVASDITVISAGQFALFIPFEQITAVYDSVGIGGGTGEISSIFPRPQINVSEHMQSRCWGL